MASVTGRINEIEQPRGGLVKLTTFDEHNFRDNEELVNENIPASIIGLAVDYLTRVIMGSEPAYAFKASLRGSIFADRYGKDGSFEEAISLIKKINGADTESIKAACKLVAYDGWYRNPYAMLKNSSLDINPDKKTVRNIQIMISRCEKLFKENGDVVLDGFDFSPPNADEMKYKKMLEGKINEYGGYTTTVHSGDGDFLTKDTLWDIKVSKYKPNSKDIIQVLMYWIMGQHSGRDVFKTIKKVGIFNPRLNKSWTLEMSKLSEDIFFLIEKVFICYK